MNALAALAKRCGIEDSFVDARGATRETSPKTRSALLAAMGLEADSEAAARQELSRLEREDWGQVLPPVAVCTQDRAPQVCVTLPAGTASVSWQVRLEDGGPRRGSAEFGQLPLVERRTLEGEPRERRTLTLEGTWPPGYHRLRLTSAAADCTLIISPGRCWLPPALERGGRIWGIAAQLYLLKSATDWGIGDFADLRQLVGIAREAGADAIGLNPLHAQFADDPEHASPYSPASRLLLNVLNIDVATLAQEAGCPQAQAHVATEDFQRSLSACRAAAQVDYAGVARLKFPVLRILFDWISARQGGHWTQFLAYRQAAGETFERHCLFLALRAHFAARHPAAPDWRQWPEGYRSPQGEGTREFAQAQATQVTFQAWLQYVADRQLQQAARAAAPLEVGLYRDLAVGADSSGAETWSNQRAVVRGAEVGAPPDIYNPQGQDWGLPPFNPLELKREAYRSFIELLRANMRHAGGLRIDHVMALQHLYWIPHGGTPEEGAYVRYPLEDLIGVLALESHRNRCLVVGEDLGTVPAGFRERMSAAAILSYRVLAFEKDAEGFVPPERYPHLSLAVAGSHDLPTLRGWWRASDLDLKEELDLFPTPQLQREARQDRDADRRGVLKAFGKAARRPLQPQEFVEAAHEYLAATASALVMVQIDDITGEETPVNVPTTSDEYPNWRRKLSVTLEQLQQHPGLQHLARRLKAVRGGQDNGGRCTDTHSAPGP